MDRSLDILAVHGFAVREGRGKWACCYEIRLAIVGGPLLYRGELHGRNFATEEAAIIAAVEIGEREAGRHIDAARAMIVALARITDGAHHEMS
ncbi:hypothetical protein ACUXAV_004127 [Cupriavidus metallidurans]|jgi:hypothetical protein|uniref:Uncharacterized protein n=1 Tax=Cupriavidus metallidurans (strain ATCC 43123 / DSM 2839 / NBRC 102507 / CH34) TaxID=266264 RepID=Q1LAY4_CUPMC|nr:hypothetical protein [Cupriavidus metallidurans]ABF12692.1 conserved hypothetical protein [Cupriavidus metallidurans CH34]AVA35352.1 hypothetical protein C3Z06_18210 [Cupriavidus metallidurans]KWW33133.1 hypothetical protein AU374_05502 [Cupriavidus metallidurans]MDE4921039.1 hypothetical protein [Cupriavidus metallidurans]QGS32122.1 hypothetical protein FOB83_24990 [Cupriavidus metallidurans]